MRTRRRFQPMLDILSSRIVPSAVSVVPNPVPMAIVGSTTSQAMPICQPDDSQMPQTGDLDPIILAPISSDPPPTLVC